MHSSADAAPRHLAAPHLAQHHDDPAGHPAAPEPPGGRLVSRMNLLLRVLTALLLATLAITWLTGGL